MTATESTAPAGSDLAFARVRNSLTYLRNFQTAQADWRARRHYRQDLRRLLLIGPHMIADIGLTLEEAQREAAKPFWSP